tara:strand:- start:885 stop:2111 length:1227 start_codon:yes stop_codon:yes gene_type:complete
MKSIVRIDLPNSTAPSEHDWENFFDMCSWNINDCKDIEEVDGKYLSFNLSMCVSSMENDLDELLTNNKKLYNDLVSEKTNLFICVLDCSTISLYLEDVIIKLDEHKLPDYAINFIVTGVWPKKEVLQRHKNKRVGFLEYNYLLSSFDQYDGIEDTKISKKIYDYTKRNVYTRGFYFNSFNGSYKNHRTALVYSLIKNNILDKGMVSYRAFDKFTHLDKSDRGLDRKEVYNLLNDEFKIDVDDNVLDKFLSIVPISFDCDYGVRDSGPRDFMSNLLAYYSSYFSIVTESFYDSDRPLIATPIWKSITSFQPFIVFGDKDYLRRLRDYGFKTFSPFIDERYDSMDNISDRFSMGMDEVIKLCSMTLLELHEWYSKMRPVLEHNFKVFNQLKLKNGFGKKIDKFLEDISNG